MSDTRLRAFIDKLKKSKTERTHKSPIHKKTWQESRVIPFSSLSSSSPQVSYLSQVSTAGDGEKILIAPATGSGIEGF